ncbi:Ribonucleotide reductase of class II (coenzyme B12-dependent) [Candidatus Phaeomarinobacter ectocarpi]|uniref:Ribonucleotide reductase of class II (Coenzyme B12-dependent) n=1 Tax=Candidatus Phaeomarinibacter ectocarpi TaxID=1458461 RepID=X5MP45_9HYPH|nr:hypothetical protein [Candidatus Phaeomarinobacter ectocarpi]CDO60901.1 Ribonucleotide reductase of class II (coenzyme B12-dependent) [Candidatus Phaeomarinobacter ectocarpi]
MQIGRYFTDTATGPYSGQRFRRVRVEDATGDTKWVFAPGTWPVSVVTTFSEYALLHEAVPSARRQLHELDIPSALRRFSALESDSKSDEPALTYEIDVRNALDRVAGGLARQGLIAGYFDGPEDALAFHDELRAALVLQKITLSSETWQRVGRDWAYGYGPSTVTSSGDEPACVSFSSSDSISSDGFLTRIASDARREQDAAALALGRNSLSDLTQSIKQALADGGPSVGANRALEAALADARARGLPAAVARRLLDEWIAGDDSWPDADTHLDDDSDIWDLLGTQTPYAVRKSDTCDETWTEPLALAALRGGAPGVCFEKSLRGASLTPADQLALTPSGVAAPAGFTPSGAVDLLAFTMPDLETIGASRPIDIDGLVHSIRLLTIALDVAHDEAGVASDLRPIAVAPMNVAAMLMSQGVAYGSDEGRALAASICGLVTAATAATSAGLAAELAPATANNSQQEAAALLRRMQSALLGNPSEWSALPSPPLYPHTPQQAAIVQAVRDILDRAIEKAEETGLRNIALTTVSNDTVFMDLLGAESAALSPVRTLVKYRRLTPELDAEAIYKVVSPAVPLGLRALRHDDASIDSILDHLVGRGSLHGAPGVNYDILRSRGFTDEDIEVTESALATASNIRAVFTPYVLGWDGDFCAQSDEDILAGLGFSNWDIEHANFHCCGALTLEGSRDLPIEHLPVFDCDEPLGEIGARHVSPADRLLMAQAVQPFLTDGLALDLQLRRETTVDGIRALYQQAEDMGLRSLRLNRNGAALGDAVDYDDLVDDLFGEPLDDLHSDIADNAYVRSIESDDLPVPAQPSADNAALNAAISLGLKHGVPVEAFQTAFSDLSTPDGCDVLGSALSMLASSYLNQSGLRDAESAPSDNFDGGASLAATEGRAPLVRSTHTRSGHVQNSEEIGSSTDTPVPNPSRAFGDPALSPPSVSGRPREE